MFATTRLSMNPLLELVRLGLIRFGISRGSILIAVLFYCQVPDHSESVAGPYQRSNLSHDCQGDPGACRKMQSSEEQRVSALVYSCARGDEKECHVDDLGAGLDYEPREDRCRKIHQREYRTDLADI